MVADPELKCTTSGVNVCSFRVAVGRRAAQGDKPQVDFFEVATWQKKAEFVTKYFHKGDPVLVRGELQTNVYTDNNQKKHYNTFINAEEVRFVGNKKEAGKAEFPPVFGAADAAEASALDGMEDIP
jgi:single-strand DNA-binding protein